MINKYELVYPSSTIKNQAPQANHLQLIHQPELINHQLSIIPSMHHLNLPFGYTIPRSSNNQQLSCLTPHVTRPPPSINQAWPINDQPWGRNWNHREGTTSYKLVGNYVGYEFCNVATVIPTRTPS